MESFKVPPYYENFAYTNRQSTISPFSYLHIASSNSDSNLLSLKESPKSVIKNHQSINNNNSFHQRCSSASSILLNIEDDQPSWLEDLLTDPKSPTLLQQKSQHMSLNDSSFILEASFDNMSCSSDEKLTKPLDEKHDNEDPNGQSGDSSGERFNSGSTNPNATKTEAKRVKQHSAHRSRVRKLKYIAELERTVQRLQVEGSGVRAELEFLNQQNLILGMENMALRKRLDTVSHEQLIKHYEQEMLERELGRIQTLHQLQNQQKMRIQQQIMQA